jgi:predicted permease
MTGTWLTWLSRTWNQLMFRSQREQLDLDLAEELAFHRRLKEREHQRNGMSSGEAAELAGQQMGNVTIAKEESRDMWGFLRLERLAQDVRYALRVLRNAPGFTLIAVASLALGIGGNVAMFTLVNTLLVRPLPYTDSASLIRITGVYPRAALPVFEQHSRSMEVASASSGSEFTLTGEGEPVRVTGSLTSPNLFDVLGASVERGRRFDTGENLPGRDGVVILSDSLWRLKFGSDPNVIGRTVRLNGVIRQIVGVMPAAFSYPASTTQLWIPARLDSSNMEEYWGGEYTPLIARLRPGASRSQARGEITSLVSQVRQMFPFPMARDWNANATVIPLQQDLTGDVRDRLVILLSSVGVVLLIACANVANLLLSRAAVRRKEIALRIALGAARLRIVRQLLTESILLALLGSGFGLLLGSAVLSVFKSLLPAGTPGLLQATVDWEVAAFAAGLAIATGVAFGIAPALSASQIDLAGSIRTGGQRSSTTRWSSLRSWLIAGEVALTLLLLLTAGLLMRSLYRLSEGNPGFDPAGIVTMKVSPNESSCNQPSSCIALYDRVLQTARNVYGVEAAAIANTVPLDPSMPTIPVDVEGHPKSVDFPAPILWAGAVSPDYRHLMSIPLLAGREFNAADTATSPAVLLITPATARRLWPGENPIGKHIKTAWEAQWRTVVGVVGDVRQYSLAESLPAWMGGAMYMPYAQSVQADKQIPAAMSLFIKTRSDSNRLRSELRTLAKEEAPDAPAPEVINLTDLMSASIGDFRSTIHVFIAFAAAAILLAVVGIYGLVSYWVTQRTYEIGLRIAIGATRQRIVSMILGQGLRVAVCGIAAGLIGALSSTRFLASQLYGVGATDPLTFVAVTILLLFVVAAATALPAWRAAQIDPVKSLRSD